MLLQFKIFFSWNPLNSSNHWANPSFLRRSKVALSQECSQNNAFPDWFDLFLVLCHGELGTLSRSLPTPWGTFLTHLLSEKPPTVAPQHPKNMIRVSNRSLVLVPQHRAKACEGLWNSPGSVSETYLHRCLNCLITGKQLAQPVSKPRGRVTLRS